MEIYCYREGRRVHIRNTDHPAQVVSVGRGYQGMVRQGHHHHDHGAEMYGYNQSHNTSTDTNRWNTEDNTPDVKLTMTLAKS